MTFRVTHINMHGRRHRLRLVASSNRLAMAWVEQLFGDAVYMAVVRLGPGAVT
jgi:hypothetical protein